jgi:hemoglobin
VSVPEDRVHATIGEDGFDRLASAFYALAERDEVLGPMYRAALAAHPGQTMEDARVRLRDFLVQRFGGPGRYSQARGHPRLRMRHMPFAIDAPAAERWIALMERAMGEAGIDEGVKATLRPYFRSTAMFMVNR